MFPRNRDFPGRMVPYFVDAAGTRCALAHLVERSGATALVERIAGSRNNHRVRALAGDQELVAWLEAAGFTLEDAERIQPQYCVPPAWTCICQINFAPTIIEGTVQPGKLVRIDALFGADAGLMVGDTVAMDGFSSEGTLVIAGYVAPKAEVYFDLVDTATVDTSGCSVGPPVFAPPTLSKETLLAIALRAAPCQSTLVAADPAWSNSSTDGCSSSSVGPTSTGTSGAATGASTNVSTSASTGTGGAPGTAQESETSGDGCSVSALGLPGAAEVALAATLCSACLTFVRRRRLTV